MQERDGFDAALAHHEAGRVAEAERLYRALLAANPAHPGCLHLLGLILTQHGEPAAGETLIRRAIALTPEAAPPRNSLALSLRAQGRLREAVAAYQEAVARRPDSPEILNNLAAMLNELGRRREAVAAWRKAVALAPGVAAIRLNLAAALDDPVEAEAAFRAALTLAPATAACHASYGNWLSRQARWTEAAAALAAAVGLAPGDAAAWSNLGVARQETGGTEVAEDCYRQAIAADAACADAHHNLGCLMSGQGDADAAVACHTAALAADPAHGAARLALCMAHLPILYRTEDEIPVRRTAYRAALADLGAAVADPLVARSVAAAAGASQPYFLPYQGQNDRDEQAAYGGLISRLLAPGPPLAPRPRARDRIRVGIVSGFFRDHTVFRLFLDGWLSHLDRDRFTVIGFHTGTGQDAQTVRAATLCDRFEQGPRPPDAWRDTVADAGAHVLLYPEVGMDPVAGRLAAQRLAPVQCVSWGQPVTTGLPTIDHFLSADLMEPPDGAWHYTENLVRLAGIGVHVAPEAPPPIVERAREVPVFWSGQALYKYLPRYDAVFPRIARALGSCRFLFIGFAKSAVVTAMFRDRLARAFAAFGLESERYCTILPPMDQAGFLAAAAGADVMLDTLGWSGGRSTLDCLSVAPAIVTCPGPLMRGRHTAAILRQIGCETTIAGSIDDYVALAVRLGRDAAWRTEVRRTVAERRHRAFGDTGPVRALERFLRAVA